MDIKYSSEVANFDTCLVVRCAEQLQDPKDHKLTKHQQVVELCRHFQAAVHRRSRP